jgi:hypothetical protein
MWIAIPSSQWTSTTYSLPVFQRMDSLLISTPVGEAWN